MRRIYLIRHGHPDFPVLEKHCLGRTDMPLGALGRMQGRLMADMVKNLKPFTLFSSPLKRAVQTAAYLGGEIHILPGTEEIFAGDWDGLSFQVIRERWPETFALRGENEFLPIPNSEDIEDACGRFEKALREALKDSSGDIAVVSHATVIGAFIARSMGRHPREARRHRLPYCGAYCLNFDGEGFKAAGELSLKAPELSPELCEALISEAELPEPLARHLYAVRKKAAELAEAMPSDLDKSLLECGALLHDIARSGANHPEEGAAICRELGYPELSEIIAAHHEIGGREASMEAKLVYIADKLILGERECEIDERFAASAEKCLSPEAKQAHERRYRGALRIKDEINAICGREIIK